MGLGFFLWGEGNVGRCFHEDSSIRIRTAAGAGPGARRAQRFPPQPALPPPKMKREKAGRGGEAAAGGESSGAAPSAPCPALRRLRAERNLREPRGGRCRGRARGMPGGMMPGGLMPGNMPGGMPGVLRPRLPGWAHLHPWCDADRGPRACAASAAPGLGGATRVLPSRGAVVYPKLGGKGAAWSGDEGEVCFKHPACVGFGIFASAGSWVRLFSRSGTLRPGCEEGVPGCV